jgi:multiple sugar transport system substrate-binding protein
VLVSQLRRRLTALVAAAVASCSLAACGGASGSPGGPRTITVWNLDGQPDRMVAVKKINQRFTDKTGITVREVAVIEPQLPSLIASAAVSGTLPDLISGLPLALLRQLRQQQLLDSRTSTQVVDGLGRSTFAPKALTLTRQGDRQLGVPSDAFVQLLAYRKDLFAEAGLAPPNTYDALLKAARTLTHGDQTGITLATDPGDPFTQQTFESLALGNDCQLVTSAGDVRLDSPACVHTFEMYGELARRYSPQGTQTVDTTRASYFAGQSAMIDWSTFLLDELAGLRSDALPTCDQCQDDPTYLAKNTGLVTAIQGPDGSAPAGYGEIVSWAFLVGHKKPAADYVRYMMSDGYRDALAIAPEGKYPVRNGDATDPTKFGDEWPSLPAGVDKKKPLDQVYDAATLKQVATAISTLQRWAIPEGQGDLLGPTVSELAIPKAVAALANGSSPQDAAEDAQNAVTDISRSLK